MSIGMRPTTEQELSAAEINIVKAKTNRRHGACNACKEAKTKCDGEIPCSACRAEKRKPRTCEYNEKAKRLQDAREEGFLRNQHESNSLSGDEPHVKEESKIPRADSPPIGPASGPSSNPSAPMHKKISLCAIVDEFIQVKPGSRAREIQNIRRVEDEWRKFQALIATPFNGADSLPREKVPQLEAWKMELQQILKQLNQGDLPGAWSSIAALLRRFSSWETFTPHIGDNNFSDPFSPAPSQAFLQERNAIYTELVELDCALGFFLGDQSLQHDFDRSRFRSSDDLDGHSEDIVDLFTTIRDVLKIDMSSEVGVWDFGRLLYRHEKVQPSTPLQRMTLCILNSDPAEKQAIKMTSCLVYAVMHCRAANIATHYSQPGVVIPRTEEGSIDIIRESKFDQSKGITMECNQVKKYAETALSAFAKLCEIDAERTAKSWIRLHSALIAAVLYGVYGLRERSANNNWESLKKELKAVEKRFLKLKDFNPDCPIFDHAIRILQSCDKQETKVKKGSTSKKSKVSAEDLESPLASDESDGPQIHPLSTETPNLRGRKRDLTSTSESVSPSRLKRRKTVSDNLSEMVSSQEQSFTEPPQTAIHIQQNIPSTEQTTTSYYEIPHPQLGSAQLLHSQQAANAFHPVSYPYSFHPPLNPDEEYWRQEGYALQYVKDHNSVHYDLVPLNQQQHYIDPAAHLSTSFMQFGAPHQNTNVVPAPQFIESASSQQHAIPSGFHATHDYGNPIIHGHIDQIPRTEAESLQQVLSSPPDQMWSSIPHSTSADTNTLVFQQSIPHAALIRRSSEPVWQMNGQYNFPSSGYPYPNPEIQAHSTSFYDSRQHYPALESINPSQNQYHHPYSEGGVETPT